jgi:hypothetical protein
LVWYTIPIGYNTMKVYVNEIDGKIDRVEIRVLRYKKLQIEKKVRTIYLIHYNFTKGTSAPHKTAKVPHSIKKLLVYHIN